jgi:hypothetical protein
MAQLLPSSSPPIVPEASTQLINRLAQIEIPAMVDGEADESRSAKDGVPL